METAERLCCGGSPEAELAKISGEENGLEKIFSTL
jgi:hypothetical protein